jgi:hypothetical protein
VPVTEIADQHISGHRSESGRRHRDAFPTNIANVIAVDAIENNFATPDVVRAPGRDVLSLAPGSHYDFYSESSLAAAEIRGVIAPQRTKRRYC